MEEPEASWASLLGLTERELSLVNTDSGFWIGESLMGSTARGLNLMGTVVKHATQIFRNVCPSDAKTPKITASNWVTLPAAGIKDETRSMDSPVGSCHCVTRHSVVFRFDRVPAARVLKKAYPMRHERTPVLEVDTRQVACRGRDLLPRRRKRPCRKR